MARWIYLLFAASFSLGALAQADDAESLPRAHAVGNQIEVARLEDFQLQHGAWEQHHLQRKQRQRRGQGCVHLDLSHGRQSRASSSRWRTNVA